MKLEGLNGELFELDIIGHEYLEPSWLMVALHVVHRTLGTWQAIDPCLQTFEVEQLAQWLENVAKGIESENHLYFLEPNLEFELVGKEENRSIRVYLKLEARPEWAKNAGWKDVWIDLPIRPQELLHASKCLMESFLTHEKIQVHRQ
jgi:hypothetical protein